MPFPSTIANRGAGRRRLAVAISGMTGGGFSEDAAPDAGWAVAMMAVVAVK